MTNARSAMMTSTGKMMTIIKKLPYSEGIKLRFHEDFPMLDEAILLREDDPWFQENSCSFYIVEENEKVIGVLAYDLFDGDHIHIAPLEVSPSYRNKGIGSKLMKEVLTLAEENNIRTLNLSCEYKLETFYNNFGFSVINDFMDGYYLMQLRRDKDED